MARVQFGTRISQNRIAQTGLNWTRTGRFSSEPNIIKGKSYQFQPNIKKEIQSLDVNKTGMEPEPEPWGAGSDPSELMVQTWNWPLSTSIYRLTILCSLLNLKLISSYGIYVQRP